MTYSEILFNEPPLVVSPKLAKLLGLNEAIVLQQLHYWLLKNPKIRDDRKWVYNSITEWREQFCFFGINTIRRVLEKLITDGIVIKGDFNKTSFDKTSWYSIDYDALDVIIQNHKSSAENSTSICPSWANGVTQNGQIETPNMGEPIPKTTQRLTTEINKKEKEAAPTARGLNVLIAEFTGSAELSDAICGFIKMRASLKKPLTDRALKILLGKLKAMGKTEAEQIALLDQSTCSGWLDIYPLKGENGGVSRRTAGGIDYAAEAAKCKK